MSELQRQAPADNRALRARLYAGEVFLLPPDGASLAFADAVAELLVEALGEGWPRAHREHGGGALFAAIGRLRRVVYLEPRFHGLLRAVLRSRGFDPARTAFDPARVRAVVHRGHDDPKARAAYFPHRDTWYANPRATITAWIPLTDLRDDETFVFFPDRFHAPVGNDSHRFDYEAWVADGWDRKIGWQDEATGTTAHYPGAARVPDGERALGFSCRRGETLLFSGAHFHQTLPQASDRTRVSLDFRLVDLDDERAGRGAPSVDDRSRGSCLVDYVHPGRPWPTR